jgi:Holliday junction resolvase RusA-like endonuclease
MPGGFPILSMTTLTYIIPLAPVPASRRWVPLRGTPYHSKTYASWRNAATAYLPTLAAPVLGLCKVLIDVACKRPQTLTADTPTGDVDNYAKAALDAISAAGIWSDDKQVRTLAIEKRYAEPDETPHTRITIVFLEPCEKINYNAIRSDYHEWLVYEQGAPLFAEYEAYVGTLCRFCTLELEADRLHWSFQLPSEVTLSRWYAHYRKYTQPLQPNLSGAEYVNHSPSPPIR